MAILDAHADIRDDAIGIVRARGQWMTRLATACVSVQKRLRTSLLPPLTSSKICWYCVIQHRNNNWDQMSNEKDTNQEFLTTDEGDTTAGVEYNSDNDDMQSVVDLDDDDLSRPQIIIC